jgi:hypothetical protein
VPATRSFSDEAIQCTSQKSKLGQDFGSLSKTMGICEDRPRRVTGSTILTGKLTLLPFQPVWDYKGKCQHIGLLFTKPRLGKTILY